MLNNQIQIFNSHDFGEISIVLDTSNQPLFCLSDLCRVLELTPSKVAQRLTKDVLSKYPLQTAGGVQQVNFVNEDGLYDVILDSRKPEAKRFRKWVTNEVLPSIRKTGGYITSKADDTPEEIMARALQVANETLKRKEERLQLLQQQNELQEQAIKEQAPKVEYHDKVLSSTSTYTVTQIAKEFGFGAETLNRKLHEAGVQYKQNGQWLLYAKYQNKGYTRTITREYTGASGKTHTSQQTVWTEPGRKFIHSLFD